LTQADIARLLDVSQQTYAKYELGRIEPPMDVKARIAAILGVSVSEVFERQEVAS
jgi:DNA-binding XRE family transcriptional regulator